MNWFLYCIRNYSRFTGRASRPEYWYLFLISLLIFFLLAAVDGLLGTFSMKVGVGLLSGLFLLGLLAPSLAVGTRRLHDTGKSGWWQLLNVVPYVGTLVLMVLLALRGGAESNRFGEPPTHDAD